VLEVGCGTGVDLPALATAVGPEGVVVGCDPSRAALAAAARRVPGVELVEAGAEALPFGDASFDACRIDRTLQHVPDPEAALRELARVVRPGGRLVVLEIATALEAGGTDGALTESIAQRIWPPGDQAWVGFLLPLLLRRTGWDHLALQQTSSASGDLADADAILRLRPAVAEAIAEGVLDEAAATAWRAGLERSARDGTLTLHVHCFRMAAVRS
jgi:SAM-dependent methyltransferase